MKLCPTCNEPKDNSAFETVPRHALGGRNTKLSDECTFCLSKWFNEKMKCIPVHYA